VRDMSRYDVDREIGLTEMTATITSMMIGVGVLTMPRTIAGLTQASDGWISITIAGMIMILFGWILAKFAVRIHRKSFYTYAGELVSKPVAFVATATMSIYFMMFSAYEVRAIGNISKQYLFERTPMEYVALCFLWIVIYAVAGSRIGVLRLNMLFLPLVLIIALFVLAFSGSIFEADNLKPMFVSDWKQVSIGVKECVFSMLGFEVVLFYVMLMNNPSAAPKATVYGVAIPVLLYVFIYIVTVGVFSQEALTEINYPTIELAKEIQVPGEFFERFESIFFTIWIMTIFNSACMGYDITIHTLNMLFNKASKFTLIVFTAPVIYMISMYAVNEVEFSSFGTIISYTGLTAGIGFPILLQLIAVFKERKKHAS